MRRPIPETLALVILSMADVFLTHHVLLGGGMELNPIGNYLIASHGFWGMVMLKLPLLALLAWALYWWSTYQESKQRKYTTALRWLDYLMSFIVGWNAGQMILQRYMG